MPDTQETTKKSRKEIGESLEELLSDFRTPTMETRRGSAVSASGSAPGGPSRFARESSSAEENVPRHTAFPVADSRAAAAAAFFAPRVRQVERPLLSEQARAVDMAILGASRVEDVVPVSTGRSRGRRDQRGRGEPGGRGGWDTSRERGGRGGRGGPGERGGRGERSGRGGTGHENDMVQKEQGDSQKKGIAEGKGNVKGKAMKPKAQVDDEALAKKAKAMELPEARPQAGNRAADDRRAPPNAPTGPRQAQVPIYGRQHDARQQAPWRPGFAIHGLANRQAVPGAGAPVGPANQMAFVNRVEPENQWRAGFDESQRHMRVRNAAFMSHIQTRDNAERREMQRSEDAFLSHLQARDNARLRERDAERRERQVREAVARQEAREAAARQEAREAAVRQEARQEAREIRELERMKIALEMKKLEAGARTRDDSRPRRRRSRSRSVERHQHARGRTTRRSRSPSRSPSRPRPRPRSPTTSHRSSVRPPRSRSPRRAASIIAAAPTAQSGAMMHPPRGPGQSLRWTPQRGTVYPQMDIVPRLSSTGPLSQSQLEGERHDARALVEWNMIARDEGVEDADNAAP
ncbi:hypothetical protein MMC27_007720 [Xylographa pallens]|nr:hypothetical protein [Xylographa pallens]